MIITILHGPNLNLLGTREPGIYGHMSLEEIDRRLRARAQELGATIQETFQTNSESELVEKVHDLRGKVDGIVFNPAAFTHTSVAIRDALLATGIPFAEVHLSNPAAREPFRHNSYLSDIAVGTISGFGVASYLFGLEGLVSHLKGKG